MYDQFRSENGNWGGHFVYCGAWRSCIFIVPVAAGLWSHCSLGVIHCWNLAPLLFIKSYLLSEVGRSQIRLLRLIGARGSTCGYRGRRRRPFEAASRVSLFGGATGGRRRRPRLLSPPMRHYHHLLVRVPPPPTSRSRANHRLRRKRRRGRKEENEPRRFPPPRIFSRGHFWALPPLPGRPLLGRGGRVAAAAISL